MTNKTILMILCKFEHIAMSVPGQHEKVLPVFDIMFANNL